MTADCQICHIVIMHRTMCTLNFVLSVATVPALWLSADSTQKFNDLLLNHGCANHTPVAILTSSAPSASN